MAKRKRLSPAAPAPDGPLETKAINGWVGVRPPPIANVSGDASVRAALDEVTTELSEARASGRMIVQLPLEAVDATHLVRDRVAVDADDMSVLSDSLSARGQQTPIEVVDLGSGRYGLISGWRRLMALRALYADTNEDRFSEVAAVIRAPETASDAYQAMIEENEVRANLSFYERARIAVKASEQGIHPTPKKAVQSLFSAARPAKRSKIISFTTLVQAFDEHLKFPADIPEKLGLAMAAKLQSAPSFRRQVCEALRKAAPQDPSSERSVLERVLSGGRASTARSASLVSVSPGLDLRVGRRQLTLSGNAIDASFVDDLREWLKDRAEKSK